MENTGHNSSCDNRNWTWIFGAIKKVWPQNCKKQIRNTGTDLYYGLYTHSIKLLMLIIFIQIVCNWTVPRICEGESGIQEKGKYCQLLWMKNCSQTEQLKFPKVTKAMSILASNTKGSVDQSHWFWDSDISAVCFSGDFTLDQVHIGHLEWKWSWIWFEAVWKPGSWCWCLLGAAVY